MIRQWFCNVCGQIRDFDRDRISVPRIRKNQIAGVCAECVDEISGAGAV